MHVPYICLLQNNNCRLSVKKMRIPRVTHRHCKNMSYKTVWCSNIKYVSFK
uniref:Uncharacterized protein n=1 Tax=Anguilla anguilla TaxID=7936 RepID=A0A0E9PGD7_ANGAN